MQVVTKTGMSYSYPYLLWSHDGNTATLEKHPLEEGAKSQMSTGGE
jgi:hypothetical protein